MNLPRSYVEGREAGVLREAELIAGPLLDVLMSHAALCEGDDGYHKGMASAVRNEIVEQLTYHRSGTRETPHLDRPYGYVQPLPWVEALPQRYWNRVHALDSRMRRPPRPQLVP